MIYHCIRVTLYYWLYQFRKENDTFLVHFIQSIQIERACDNLYITSLSNILKKHIEIQPNLECNINCGKRGLVKDSKFFQKAALQKIFEIINRVKTFHFSKINLLYALKIKAVEPLKIKPKVSMLVIFIFKPKIFLKPFKFLLYI